MSHTTHNACTRKTYVNCYLDHTYVLPLFFLGSPPHPIRPFAQSAPNSDAAHVFFITRNYSDSAAAAAAAATTAGARPPIYFARQRRRQQSYFVIRVSCCDPRGYRHRRRAAAAAKGGGGRERAPSVPWSGLALESRFVAVVSFVVSSERS